MTQPMNIRPDVAYREQAVQMQFLRERVLVLAQTLADVTLERDQALAEREALSKELDELRDEQRVDAERQEVTDGAAE
jgi:hypothetical protein